ncbi:glycoside hydrolase family 3 N-terminal domain-containing protein [Pectinatus brassicae]|uniref:beta-N-acetylhexosaminidase n=1 Tax=Pectinatus brassicae TaxID=862415 RepID=A0A840UM41_9FIRM|nr:glycoside hydrolase family 3 N-terminal domain-containing protein [Pectinatus brassicae]MBB5337270.1 beta-N-acetylhexosaminidase [Pectinatus brassicae]
MKKSSSLYLKFIIVCCIFFLLAGCSNINSESKNGKMTADTVQQKENIDSKAEKIVASMSLSEKIGQMMMIGVRGKEINDDSRYLLNEYHMGGIIFFDRNMQAQEQVRKFTEDLQKNSNEKVPLFIAMDEEGGRVVRMKNALIPPPSQQEIGQSGDIDNAQKWAQKTAKSLKEMGINVNFAPVADVGSNDTRSYSKEAKTVTEFVAAAAKGYEQENIIYALKHFPGIGKGKVDSHKELSAITASEKTLQAEDFLPFQTVVKNNNPDNYMILVSHLKYTALDEKNPASLSTYIITELLRKKMGYKGIVITDDMEMGAVSKHYNFSELGVKAVQAGADIVMVCHEYPHEEDVYMGLLDAAKKGEISQSRIDESVKRIVKVKLQHLK